MVAAPAVRLLEEDQVEQGRVDGAVVREVAAVDGNRPTAHLVDDPAGLRVSAAVFVCGLQLGQRPQRPPGHLQPAGKQLV
jgi:hypothetical protein